MNRDIFAQKALAELPKILTLLDRNPHSPTYGCFDRNYWHYKIIDFPSGMSQEFVWPLTLAYFSDVKGSVFYKKEKIKQWVHAGITFAARSAHKDGSCDDYFPFEKASGASAFSLLAGIESYRAFQLQDQTMLGFFEKRGNWLANHYESGRLSNHEALIVLCLDILAALLGTDRWKQTIEKRLKRLLSWQDPEGWFQEYDGCDPGYHTLTVSLLAQYYQRHPEADEVRDAVSRAVDLTLELQHPDGTIGGEYSSRNTNNFFPHGFELIGAWKPEALLVNDRFGEALKQNNAACYSDDHIIGHHVWSYLMAWRDYSPHRRQLKTPKPQGRNFLENAGILIERRGNKEIYISLNKGGAFKLFVDGRLVCSDTQFSLQIQNGKKIRNAVGHLIDDYECRIEDESILISGKMGWAKQKMMTTFNLLLLRVFMIMVGRLNPNLVRKLLQKMLIVGKKPADCDFSRTFTWDSGRLKVRDTLKSRDWSKVRDIRILGDQTSIYIAMSRTFHPGQLLPDLTLKDRTRNLENGEALQVEREFA